MTPRCPNCYRPLRDIPQDVHDVTCAARTDKPKPPNAPKEKKKKAEAPQSQAGYVPPSRSDRVPRGEYLDSIRKTPEQKQATRRAIAARYRDRKRTERQAARGTA